MKKYRNWVLGGVVVYGLVHYFASKELRIYVSIVFLVSISALFFYTLYQQFNNNQKNESSKTEFISVAIVAIILSTYFIIVDL